MDFFLYIFFFVGVVRMGWRKRVVIQQRRGIFYFAVSFPSYFLCCCCASLATVIFFPFYNLWPPANYVPSAFFSVGMFTLKKIHLSRLRKENILPTLVLQVFNRCLYTFIIQQPPPKFAHKP